MSKSTESSESSKSPQSGLPDPTIHITTHNPSTGLAEIHTSSKNDWSWLPATDVSFNVVYTTSQFPANLNDDVDIKAYKDQMARGDLGLVSPGGTVCRIVDFAPGNNPLMHRTQSLDYGIVLKGELEMELDDGSVTLLKQGDMAIQRATMHAWRNPHPTEWARMLFVLQDCQPVVIGGKRFKEDLGARPIDIPKSGNDV
ncbi:hypothetical protein F5884DRAFT_784914 [Xylogone sp. PMI_703]|nr:hypothetical protein F5884DRAFT_784914 [Xylogone sp. PMI_703]